MVRETIKPIARPRNVTYGWVKQTRPPVLVAVFGGNLPWLARVETPFILERANPSKDGDAKLWAYDDPRLCGACNGCQAAEGMGR
jgi:hypothetical protein